jgi:hypothetical protein
VKNGLDIQIKPEGLLRLPKGSEKEDLKQNISTKHIVKKGNLMDFIVEFIPKKPIGIDEYNFMLP